MDAPKQSPRRCGGGSLVCGQPSSAADTLVPGGSGLFTLRELGQEVVFAGEGVEACILAALQGGLSLVDTVGLFGQSTLLGAGEGSLA